MRPSLPIVLFCGVLKLFHGLLIHIPLQCPDPPPCSAGAAMNCACPAGSYQTMLGVVSDYSKCILCGSGTYQTGLGMTSAGSCVLCPAGQYSTADGAQAATTCAPCGPGTFSTASGATDCTPIVALPLLPSDGPCELRNLTWKVSSSLGFLQLLCPWMYLVSPLPLLPE